MLGRPAMADENGHPGGRGHLRGSGLFGLGLLGALLSTSCSHDSTLELDVYSWWTQRSEQVAFEQVENIHHAAHPDVVVVNRADPDAVGQRERMGQLMLAGAPPATFTANAGADLLHWAVVDIEGHPDEARSWVHSVSDVAERTGLSRVMPAELRQALTVGDASSLFAIPINIHRLNVLYYNVDTMQRLAAERPGVDLLSFASLCPASDPSPLPDDLKIAIGTEDDFALILFALESVLPAESGANFYDALLRGQSPDSTTSPGAGYLADVKKAFECVQGLSRHFVRGTGQLRWFQALNLVRSGDAAFTVMGDWANGELVDELLAGSVAAMPFPGSESTFVFTSDTFPLPIGAEHITEVSQLLETIASPPAQRAFSSVKGSLPARTDVRGLGRLDTIIEQARAAFDDPNVSKVLATSGRFPPYYQQENLAAALRVMTGADAGADEIAQALAEFDSQEPLFTLWQARLDAGPAPPRAP
jgi:glucose/mannose transport system substrate-binding protein